MDFTWTQSDPSSPGAPVETAGGDRPTAVMANRWFGANGGEFPSTEAAEASRGEPREAAVTGAGTHTDRGRRIGSRCRRIWAVSFR